MSADGAVRLVWDLPKIKAGVAPALFFVVERQPQLGAALDERIHFFFDAERIAVAPAIFAVNVARRHAPQVLVGHHPAGEGGGLFGDVELFAA